MGASVPIGGPGLALPAASEASTDLLDAPGAHGAGSCASTALRARAVDDELTAVYLGAHCTLDHDGPSSSWWPRSCPLRPPMPRVNTVTPRALRALPRRRCAGGRRPRRSRGAAATAGHAAHPRRAAHRLGERAGRALRRRRAPGAGGAHDSARRRAQNRQCCAGQRLRAPAITVDTHVGRLSRRLGWTTAKDPVRVERDLSALWEPERWTDGCHRLIEHGRAVCGARAPRCGECVLLNAELCPQVGV